MQDKKNQHILFSKTISVKQHERLNKLLKKYPYSLNLQYKALKTAILLDQKVDKLEYKRLSTYAIDKPFFKMKFKNLRTKDTTEDIEVSLDAKTDIVVNHPIEASSANNTEQIQVDEPTLQTNFIEDIPVKQEVIDEKDIMMAPKKEEQKRADQAPESVLFLDWLEGLNKSKPR